MQGFGFKEITDEEFVSVHSNGSTRRFNKLCDKIRDNMNTELMTTGEVNWNLGLLKYSISFISFSMIRNQL